MSGRALFEFKPEMFIDDDNAAYATEMELVEEHDDKGTGQPNKVHVDEGLFEGEELGIDEDELFAMASKQLEGAEEEEEEEEEAVLPKISDQELNKMSKTDLIALIQKHGSEKFVEEHKLNGELKNIAKKSSLPQLIEIYKALEKANS